MAISRRDVIRLGQACLAAAALPKIAFGDPVLPPTIGRSQFEPLVGGMFAANVTSMAPTWLTLTSVEDLAVQASTLRVQYLRQLNRSVVIPETESFTLHFSAVGAPLKEGIHEFQNGSLGVIEMFVTPGDRSYVAAFNLLKGPVGNFPTRVGSR
jgi:hypothetical protein